MIMYGLKNESLIFRLKQPETTIGRHPFNDITIPKSLKVSRFHAIISFLGEAPLIKDISEWGVYLNNSLIRKHRWAELKLGDVIALGALTRDDGGRIVEVVAWESENNKYHSTGTIAQQKRIEIIDISDGDGEDVYVIDICSDSETTENKSCSSSRTDYVTKEVSKASLEIILPSDEEDEFPVLPRKHEESIPQFFKTSTNTKVLVPSTSEMDVSFNENQIIAPSTFEMEISPTENQVEVSEAIPSVVKIKPKLACVTPAKKSLFEKSMPFDYPKAFQSIMNYASDEDNNSSFNDLKSSVHEDVRCYQEGVKLNLSAKCEEDVDIKSKLTLRIPKSAKHESELLVDKHFEEFVPLKWTTSNPVKIMSENEQTKWLKPKHDFDSTEVGYQSPFDIFSKLYDDNNGYSSDDSSTAALANKAITPIIHKTLLTNKIAKIAVIAPLPNKKMARRRKRRSESSESHIAHVERDLRLSESLTTTLLPYSKKNLEKKSQSLLFSAPREKKNLKSIRDATKQTREKIRAMYPVPPTKIQKTAASRPKPKVKVTDKNRGDFLTRLKPVCCHRSSAKSVNPQYISPEKPVPTTEPVKPEDYVESLVIPLPSNRRQIRPTFAEVSM